MRAAQATQIGQGKFEGFALEFFELHLLLLAQHVQHDLVEFLLSADARKRWIIFGSTEFANFFKLFVGHLQLFAKRGAIERTRPFVLQTQFKQTFRLFAIENHDNQLLALSPYLLDCRTDGVEPVSSSLIEFFAVAGRFLGAFVCLGSPPLLGQVGLKVFKHFDLERAQPNLFADLGHFQDSGKCVT